MRIYNGKKSTIELPLGNGQKIVVGPGSVSSDFLPSTNFLNMLVTTFHYDEIALIVNGINEMNLCSSVSCVNGFVVHTIADAVERFSKPCEETAKPNPAVPEEKKEEEPKKTSKKKSVEKTTPNP